LGVEFAKFESCTSIERQNQEPLMQLIWRISILSAAMNLILFAAPSRSAAPQAQPNGPQGFNYCAAENEICVFSGTQNVAFGANGVFYYKIGLSGHVTCDAATFGDPITGTPKACYVTGDQHQEVSPQPLAGGYSFCSDEGKTCAFAGMRNVAFGANGRFYYESSLAGSIVCDGARFGDPIQGVAKACYISAPLEAPPPPPPPPPDATGDPFRTAASLFQNKQYAQALPFFKQAAAAGNSDAEVCLGWMYQFGATLGEGVPQDYKEAVSWYQRAVDAHDAAGEFYLGAIYQIGSSVAGVPQDYARALSLYKKAAAGGEAPAESALGTMYQFGQGVPRDYAQALAWYQKAATAGDAWGEWNLGVMYANGLGVAKDPEMAALWQGKAKQSGPRLPSDPVQLAATLNYSNSATGPQGNSAAPSPSAPASSPDDSTATSQASPSCGTAASPPPQSQVVDVRYTPPETRIITDEELANLKQGLHYDPPCAPLAPGGSATTTLVDGADRALASITVQWLSTSGPSAAPTANFRITLQNMSNCEISPQATLAIPGSAIGADAVGFATWGQWVALHDPSGGESQTFDGTATLDQDYRTLILNPKNPELALSQCRTKGQQIADTAWQTQDVQFNSLNGQAHIRYKESVSIDGGTVTLNTDSTVQFIGDIGDYECRGPCTHEDLWTDSMAISDIVAIDEGPFLGDGFKSDANDLWVVNLHSKGMGVVDNGHVISGCTGTCAPANDEHAVAISIFFNDEGAALAAKQALLALVSGQ
jgi:TPR repeat protein